MAIAESITRLASTLLSIAHTRLELAAVELQEETRRLLSYLIWALVAVFCLGTTLLLGVFLIVVLYWDTHRIGAMVSLMVIFGGVAFLILLGLRSSLQKKPRLFTHTLNEFKRDYERLHRGK